MMRTKAKTKYLGKVWCHERYVNALAEGRSLVIEYKDKVMTITPEDYLLEPPQKGTESFRERFGPNKGKLYYLYGFTFKPDEFQASAKKAAKMGEALSQCPHCMAVKITTGINKTGWQPSIAEFQKLPKEVCSKCYSKSRSTGGNNATDSSNS